MKPCDDCAAPNNALSCNVLNSSEIRSIYIHYCATLTISAVCDPRFDRFQQYLSAKQYRTIFAQRNLFFR